ncbi:MAG TPA: hypothetical protein VG165_00170 [Solirubrobacteraceae bacterium]|nr:hypothetical protein [Solirubrobacteraceae bacterium]
MPADLPELILPDVAAWRAWLGAHHAQPTGVWLVLAKKGVLRPTSVSYDEAVEEAVAHGWIDGQNRRRDDATYAQRFTPRRAGSNWSQSNVRRVDRLTADGRMHPAGLAEVDRARADGRWPPLTA